MRINELVEKINSYVTEADGIQQEFPFLADFAGLPEEDEDVLILTSGRLIFAEYVTCEDDGRWYLVCGADSNISVNGHDKATLSVLTEEEADSIWSILREKVEEILEEVQ
jgi:hypothetical protein